MHCISGYLAEFRAEVPVVVVCESEVIVCESEYVFSGVWCCDRVVSMFARLL